MGTNHLVDEPVLYGISVDFKFYLTQLATSVVLLLLLRDGERERELLNKDLIRGPDVFDTRRIISLNICFSKTLQITTKIENCENPELLEK